ncbi:hypothetical protein MLD38_033672 [Melastoma candidum]|uniref:Uncharacterized protein n=1 Tax=Melastoma candidum TaxID=119954 RepID=A0ACB9M833_9MYRT|nr:hypothetical protein MLD38_033672 [Melastoma candidum]
MCAMCQVCGSEMTPKINEETEAPMNCNVCDEKKGEHSIMRRDILGPTFEISPTTSLSSSDSSVSSYSDFSVEVNSLERGNRDESAISTSNTGLNNRLLDSKVEETNTDGLDQPSNWTIEDKTREFVDGSRGDIAREIEIIEGRRLPIMDYPGCGENGNCSAFGDEMENKIWEPPEPEDPGGDAEGVVGNGYDDDDDECAHDTEWRQPGHLGDLGSSNRRNFPYYEEKRRAMDEVINGKFKAVVRQLLESFGIQSLEDGNESWVDILTSLSWRAASFLKPDVVDGKAMDPDLHVKIKCVATGARSDSQFVKGLVFKKRAAHKHMPTVYNNPKLLLIKGVLGQASSGLSSFDSLKLEKDGYLKSVMEMIEMCYPNVILVEKSVSRDIQESILAKGMTLIFDMKLHRLERIARCTGSSIVSTDKLNIQKLKYCESFHIEKFVEEHAGLGEGGKRPCKTLMFLEGCPMRLGCTILLKGSHSDELKKIKSVMQCSVVLAYHLILETSFVVDQRAMFFTIPAAVINTMPNDQPIQTSDDIDSGDFSPEHPPLQEDVVVDIPIANGFHGSNNLAESDGNSPFFNEPYNPVVFSGFSSLSSSLRRVIGNSLPASTNYPSLSSYFGFSKKDADGYIDNEDSLRANSEASEKSDVEVEVNIDNGKPDDEQTRSIISSSEAHDEGRENGDCVGSPSKGNVEGGDNGDCVSYPSKGNVKAVLDTQSILVLMSRRNALRGIICEQSHFSRITFYKNFDVPLGKFLRENVLNQRSQCRTCSEPPEAHYYYYAHHHEQLTIQVKRLPLNKELAGAREGKLWMWSCCNKCKIGNKAKSSTKRILLSSTARRLSFGKFLELSFAHHSTVMKTGICGHSLRRDYLYFFGFGPLVAMFKYSPVTTYTVSMPPQKQEFHISVRSDCPKEETDRVYTKGKQLFSEIQSSLKKIGAKISGSISLSQGLSMELSEIQDMLKHENREFELKMQPVLKSEYPGGIEYKLLVLNRVLWELYIESVIWDRRIHSLLRDPSYISCIFSENPVLERSDSESVIFDSSSGNEGAELDRNSRKETPGRNISEEDTDSVRNIPIEDPLNKNQVPRSIGSTEVRTEPETNAKSAIVDDDRSSLPAHSHAKIQSAANSTNLDATVNSKGSQGPISLGSVHPNTQSSDAWIWKSFSEIREMYEGDLRRGCSRKYEPCSGLTAKVLPTVLQLISSEGSRLHIPLDDDFHMVSDFEGELSSIIACALAFLKDQLAAAEPKSDDSRFDTGMSIRAADSLQSLIRFPSMSSTHSSSSSGSFDSDSLNSPISIISEESHLSSFDGLMLLDSLLPPENLKAEVSLAVAKSVGKGRYSVICLYANQFRDLRNLCGLSEDDFIASLSRCKDWDAKGGKSKSFFAKTLDDRLIIKEIKKTEFESFEKFAPHYFKYMKQSFESGNQTCLAKVLGIYQVTIRQLKTGKEVRHDLMVMENLSFGRKITRQYDLKGALHARFTSATDGTGDVLLDQNFVNDMNSSPLYVSNTAKNLLQRAVWNDTSFLNSVNVMDYSLLVGVDGQKQELVCGIIDYLRQYTWDKQLETWVKSSLYVPKNVLPTVISPKEYKKRFRKFMAAHFLCVPDDWCSRDSTGACEICSINCDSSQPSPDEQNA